MKTLTIEHIVKVDEDFRSNTLIKNDEALMEAFLRAHPLNVDLDIVIQKIRLIDLVNSTQLFRKRNLPADGRPIEEVLADAIVKGNENSNTSI